MRGVVGLHASFTVSDETIREAGALCRELGTVLHVHVAEDRADVDDARAPRLRRAARAAARRSARCRPARSSRTASTSTPAEVRRADERGLLARAEPALEPRQPRRLPGGAGAASARVALGTDGYPADMGAEHAALLELGAAHGEPMPALDARLLGSQRLARALFPDDADGAAAAAPPPAGDAAGFVRDVAAARAARTVVGGRTVIANGRLLTGDLEALRAHGARGGAAAVAAHDRGRTRETAADSKPTSSTAGSTTAPSTRFREAGVVLPTFAQLADPATHPAPSARAALADVDPDAPDPLNLFRVHWYNDARAGARAGCPSTSCCRSR